MITTRPVGSAGIPSDEPDVGRTMSNMDWQQRQQRKQNAIQRGRQRVLGMIVIVWGAGIIAYSLYYGGPQGEGAYFSGQMAGWVFCVLLIVVGLFYVLRKDKGRPAKKSPAKDDQPGTGP